MTKEQFKQLWQSDENGGGITIDDVAACYVSWGLGSRPRTKQLNEVLYKVLLAANIVDAEDFKPYNECAYACT